MSSTGKAVLWIVGIVGAVIVALAIIGTLAPTSASQAVSEAAVELSSEDTPGEGDTINEAASQKLLDTAWKTLSRSEKRDTCDLYVDMPEDVVEILDLGAEGMFTPETITRFLERVCS